MQKVLAAAVAGVLLLSGFGLTYAAQDDAAAEALRTRGILEGDAQGELHLEAGITRAEFAKLLVRALELTEEEDLHFTDLPEGHWAYSDIAKAVRAGILNGFADGTIQPDAPVTYEQAVKMVVCAYGEDRLTAYPADYLAAGIARGYLDNVNALTSEMLTRADAVNLIYNAQMKKEAEQTLQSGTDTAYVTSGGGAATGAASTASGGASGASPGSASGVPEGGGYGMPFSFNTESYSQEDENVFKNVLTSPLSTFSIDVDTASYSNMRRFLLRGSWPAEGSIRTEELINYFDYQHPQSEGDTPLGITTEVAVCPWNPAHQLAMVAVQGQELPQAERQPSNLVFLLDVSGSMHAENKLPLVQKSMALLLDTLDERDTISIVTYANGVRTVLDSVPASEKDTILDAVYSLRAGGGTAGSAGLDLAYELAEKNKIEGNNRIILCTDGDFNIGPSSDAELEQRITEKRDAGIFLSVLGFGMGNYKDSKMERIADQGNGNYAYIDTLREAKKVLVDEMTKTLYTIAKDVKIQAEFNPAKVKEYRLVGYENRKLNDEDFADDQKDAGELGAGATVTVFYELVPADGSETQELRYQESTLKDSPELFFVKLRYKEPDGTESQMITHAVPDETVQTPSETFCFAAAVAEFGMLLNRSAYTAGCTMDDVITLARQGLGEDTFGFRREFIQLVDLARLLPVPDAVE